MLFSRVIIFFFISSCTVLMLMITHTLADRESYYWQTCIDDKGNYTANSTYQRNLNTVLTSLPTSKNSTGYGFYYSSYGKNPDRVEAILLCRGNVNAYGCLKCYNNSRVGLTEQCPNQKEAFRWTNMCTLRYSNRSIYGNMETTPSRTLYNGDDVLPPLATEFLQQHKELLLSLRDEAASAGPLRKFAIGNRTIGSSFIRVYALMECTPDLSEKECSDCLDNTFAGFDSIAYGKKGAFTLGPSCFANYELSKIIDPATVVPLPSPPQPSPTSPPSINKIISAESKGSKSRTTVVIIVVSVGTSLVILIMAICICLRLRKAKKMLQRKRKLLPGEDDDEILSSEFLQFDFDTIRNATDNFSDVNLLGKGGFGSVYKGQLTNGKLMAVKRLWVN